MEPQVTLYGLLQHAKLYQEGKLSAREAAQALSTGLLDLAEWCWRGGYAPDWPQRPLTDAELGELAADGHRG
jgi:hypothetical protein